MYNLDEVRFFLSKLNFADDVFVISDDNWAAAKRAVFDKYRNSSKLEICINLIKDFEATNPKKKYRSDFEVFIRESRLEDFFNDKGETIFVSTIHKAKGKEFDNVFLMLDNFNPDTDEAKRQMYVAMTRAKQNLTIHLNSKSLDNIFVENLERVEDREIYLPPRELAMHLAYKDVWLDFFISKQYLISQLQSGDVLNVKGDECLNARGQTVLKFSKHFQDQIESLKQRNYEPTNAKVNFIVYWQKEGMEKELKILLPELHFEKINDES